MLVHHELTIQIQKTKSKMLQTIAQHVKYTAKHQPDQ